MHDSPSTSREVDSVTSQTAETADDIERNFHTMSLQDVISSLSSNSERGLSSVEAKKRLAIHGPNTIKKVKGSFWKVYLAPILNWLINIYLISSFALLILAYFFQSTENQVGQALLWLGVVAVNCFVAIFQQFRAQKKLEALEKLSAGEARVVRDNAQLNLPPEEIVPGDIIILEQGDKIPADSRILNSSNLTVNEASLTGESVPVDKNGNVLVDKDAPLTDMKNMTFFGTYVATGTARVIATETGSGTEIGKIQGTLEELNTGDIPLRRKINRLAKYLGIAAIFLMILSVTWALIWGPLLTGQPINLDPLTIADTLTAGITKAMTIMPINIPLLSTIVLLTGVLAMAKMGVIIRDLSAVESLGRVSLICSDKTGTMTRNQMTVKYIWDTENLYSVSGAGYIPEGGIYRVKDGTPLDTFEPQDEVRVSDVLGWKSLHKLLVCGGINNDSEIITKELPEQGIVHIPMGDPTDAALLTLFRKSGLDEVEIEKKYPIVKEFPFESDLKRMSKICRDENSYIAFVKGATEILLPKCTKHDGSKKPTKMSSEMRDRIMKMTTDFATKGYRVISLAYKNMKSVPNNPKAREETESGLIYLGFACIVDPPREGVKEAVNACHSAGINVIMITGDAAATAKTIAADLNIFKPNSLAIEGSEIDELSPEDFQNVNVFARVNPEHKQVIVERYQDQKKVVAMTGDGVNDALALAMSDAGIAMGITGTDVAKEAADLVITDDSFSSIVTGVHEGRGLFNKIRMMVYFYVAINLFESIVFFGGMFLLPAGFNMLTAWQSLYIVVTTHSFPGLALVFDKTSPRAMEDKPRDSEEIITHKLAKFMGLSIVLMTIGAAIVYGLTYSGWGNIIPLFAENQAGFYADWIDPITNEPFAITSAVKATVMLLTILLLIESSMVLVIRRINLPLIDGIREPGIWRYAVLLGLIYLAHLLLMYVPIAQAILAPLGLHFYFIPLTTYDWIICILAAAPAIIGMEIYKKYLRMNDVSL
jgi:Ca2+-transporting ATPase